VRLSAEGEAPKRLIGDFSIFSDAALEEQLRSPLDIDHWPYVDAVVVHDTGGALRAWRRRIAAFPRRVSGARRAEVHPARHRLPLRRRWTTCAATRSTAS